MSTSTPIRLLVWPVALLAVGIAAYWLVDLYLTIPTFEAPGRGVPVDPECAEWTAEWRTLDAALVDRDVAGSLTLVDLDVDRQQASLMTIARDTVRFNRISTVHLARHDLLTGEPLIVNEPLVCTGAFPTAGGVVYYCDRRIRRLDAATFEPLEDITLNPGALQEAWHSSTSASWERVVRLPDGDYAGYVRSHSLNFWARISPAEVVRAATQLPRGDWDRWIMPQRDGEPLFVMRMESYRNEPMSQLQWAYPVTASAYRQVDADGTLHPAGELAPVVQRMTEPYRGLTGAPPGWVRLPNAVEGWSGDPRPGLVLECSVPRAVLYEPVLPEGWWARRLERLRRWRRARWLARLGRTEYQTRRSNALHIDAVVWRGATASEDRVLSETFRQSLAQNGRTNSSWRPGEGTGALTDCLRDTCELLEVPIGITQQPLPDGATLLLQELWTLDPRATPDVQEAWSGRLRVGILASDAFAPVWYGWLALPDATKVSDPRATRIGDQLLLWYPGNLHGPIGTEPAHCDPVQFATVPLPEALQSMPEGEW